MINTHEIADFVTYKRSLFIFYGVIAAYTVIYLAVANKIGIEFSVATHKKIIQESVFGLWFLAVAIHAILYGKSYSFYGQVWGKRTADVLNNLQDSTLYTPPLAKVLTGVYLYLWTIPLLLVSTFFMIRGLAATYQFYIATL